MGNINEMTLPDLCLAIHTQHTGASEPWSPGDVDRAAALLRSRLLRWRPSLGQSQRFDDAVRGLVEATLAEIGGAQT